MVTGRAALGAAFMGGTKIAIAAAVADHTAKISMAGAGTAPGTVWLTQAGNCAAMPSL